MPEPMRLRDARAAPWPDPPPESVYHGLAGEVVREVLPHTEADPVGLLVTFLAAVGNVIGPGPHYVVSGARHELRTYPVLVGASGSGRKGTALATLAPIFEAAFPAWWGGRQKGLVSGEGLIWHVRDAQQTREAVRQRGRVVDYEAVVADHGVEDKRLLITETEFGGLLQVLGRERNTLSMAIRDAWDGGPLTTMAKHHAARATGAHVTIVGHVTPEELLDLLGDREAVNGFANRFLWLCVRRSKLLPRGGDVDEGTIVRLGQILEATVEDARGLGRLHFQEEAGAAWDQVYEDLTTGEPGLIGRILERAAPMVLRLALTYAALDVSPLIRPPHLRAALDLWEYADASVRHIYGAAAAGAEDPLVPTILAALAGGDLHQSELHDLFGRNLKPRELASSLDRLRADGRIACTFERPASGRGRSAARWSLVQ